MFRRHLTSRTLQVGALGVALCLCAKPGSSEDKGKAERRACAATYKSALQVEQAGRLRQAKDLPLSCAKATCGAHVKQLCTTRYAQLESDIPSVVPLVSDENGEPRVDVQVTIDNELLTSRLDGRALPVDPGVHEFSFTADGAVVATQKVMIPCKASATAPFPFRAPERQARQACRARSGRCGVGPRCEGFARQAVGRQGVRRKARARGSRSRKGPRPKSSSPEKAKLRVGRGAAARGRVEGRAGRHALPARHPRHRRSRRGGAAHLLGKKDNEQLAQCSPNCSQESVDHIKKLYLAADISLGVGAAALATSVIWFIASPSSKEKPPSQATYTVDVQPTPTGGFASVSGRF